MVPKLHAKGKSFRGAAAYLLHDKDRATSSERVAWTETRNLATDDPETAWRIMAATAMDQQRLKAQAGIGNTGRKSVDSVLHLTLSWHPDEHKGLTREEMLRAAHGAIRALGAEDRQALFVCHNDEPQPHIHVLLNRVSPDDGRMLSSSKEKLNLSRWAQAYEQERGPVLCEERVINNAARERNEFTRGEPSKARHIYELEAANDNRPDAEQIRDQQRQRDADIAKRDRDTTRRHAAAWEQLQKTNRERVLEIRHSARTEIIHERAKIIAAFRPRWRALHQQHAEERKAFDRNEQNMTGRVGNAFRAMDLRALMRKGERARAIRQSFQVLASRGARLEALNKIHAERERSLAKDQRAAERAGAAKVRLRRARALEERRRDYEAERSDLRLTHRADRAVRRGLWRKRAQEREDAWNARPPREKAKDKAPMSAKDQVLARRKRRRDHDRDGHDRGR